MRRLERNPLTRSLLLPTLGLWVLMPGCSSSESVDASLVKAVSVESETVKTRERLAAKAADEARAKKEAADAEAKALHDAIDAAAIAPAEPPVDLATACDDVVAVYDEFMKSGSEKDALLWSDGRRHKLGERRTGCQVGDLAIAGCEIAALSNPPAALDTMPRRDGGLLLMERCHEKFGSQSPE